MGIKILLNVFFLPFLGVGLFTLFVSAKHLATAFEASSWTEVPATVHSAHTLHRSKESGSGQSRSYYIEGSFSYIYQGQKYHGTKIGIRDKGGFGLAFRNRIRTLEPYIGSKQTFPCYVNPSNPHEALLFPGPVWDFFGLLSIVTLIFGGVGAGGIYFLRHANKIGAVEEKLKAQFPDEPWKQNHNWLDAKVSGQGRAKAIVIWMLALFWNGVSSPILLVFPEEWADGNKLIAIGLIFPLIGVGLIYTAVRASIRWLKYGRSELRLNSFPGVIGGKFSASLILPVSLNTDGGMHFRLNCTQTITTGSGENRSTTKNLLWQDEIKTVAGKSNFRAGEEVPIEFTIPYDCQQSDRAKRINWTLEVQAETPGVDYQTDFVVPVYITPKSDGSLTQSSISNPSRDSIQPKLSAKSKIEINRDGEGIEIYCPAAIFRIPGTVVGYAVFIAIWTGFILLMRHLGAPLFFPIIFALVDLLLIFILFDYCFKSVRLKIEAGRLSKKWSYLSYRNEKEYPLENIKDIDYQIAGYSQVGNKQTAHYSIILKEKRAELSGKRRLIEHIVRKEDAKCLSALIKESLGLDSTRLA